MNTRRVPVVGFCAWSGTGKTTLLVRLLPLLVAKGFRVAVVKRAHHKLDIDHPGKDSYELRKAGASQMLISSGKRMALITELEDGRDEPSLTDALDCLNLQNLDLILVEGYKRGTHEKIELHRAELKKPLFFPGDPSVIAIASDAPIPELRGRLPRLDLNDPEQIAQFIVDRFVGIPSTSVARDRP
ncbi:MAG: molybdopterin-guanine dinucleotide biosynthesis protein B [Pseudomonadota bacterium]|nr:molybdopterin-guanine dinucleotide biosynthesis protein B [Pseudomonadota bacterium]